MEERSLEEKYVRGSGYIAKFIKKGDKLFLITQFIIPCKGMIIFNGEYEPKGNDIPLKRLFKLFTPEEIGQFDLDRAYVSKIKSFGHENKC